MDSYGDSVMKHLSESSGLSDHRLRRLPGLASRHELRQKLHCKSFHWYFSCPPTPVWWWCVSCAVWCAQDVLNALVRYVENVIYRIARKWGFPLVPEEQS